MAWYAKIANDIVIEITYLIDTKDSDWLYREYGGEWIRAAENGELRKHFPAIGYLYNKKLDAFIPPQPYQSWILNEETCLWGPPIPYPDDGSQYGWDESTTSWVTYE
jgi:hypothetical protein